MAVTDDTSLPHRIIELEEQVSVLSRENSQLRAQQGQAARAESEIAKHHARIRTEQSIAAVRQLLRTPYVERELPTVHRIIRQLREGYAPKDAANWLDLKLAQDELNEAKTDALAGVEDISAELHWVIRASELDRQTWLDAASDDLRNLWHLPKKEGEPTDAR